MNVQRLAQKSGAAQATTSAQQMMVLASIGSAAMPAFLQTLGRDSPVTWLRTLLDMGALDLGQCLRGHDDTKSARKGSDGWAEVAQAFLGTLGKHYTVPSKTGPWKVFRPKEGAVEIFKEATVHLARQAKDIELADRVIVLRAKGGRGLDWPRDDDAKARENKAIAALSTWASVACLLDLPRSLKILIDAFPQAMWTATPRSEQRVMMGLSLEDGINAFDTTNCERQFVSPMFCALHASSTGCIDVLHAKRKELGLPIDPPVFSWDDGSVPWKTLSQRAHFIGDDADPNVIVHALRPVIAETHFTENPLAWNVVTHVDKNKRLFTALAAEGLFHVGSPSLEMGALKAALKSGHDALPHLLERMTWATLIQDLGIDSSPLLLFMADKMQRDDVKAGREAAVLSLIEHAKTHGHSDAMFKTFALTNADFNATVDSPVAQISAGGYHRVLVEFLNHGYDPKQKGKGVDLSLLELAEREKHETLGTIHSHIARSRAHRLLDVIDQVEPNQRSHP